MTIAELRVLPGFIPAWYAQVGLDTQDTAIDGGFIPPEDGPVVAGHELPGQVSGYLTLGHLPGEQPGDRVVAFVCVADLATFLVSGAEPVILWEAFGPDPEDDVVSDAYENPSEAMAALAEYRASA